ncbi:DUF2971 domain-containing protein [Nitrosomonas sp. Nm33]|uniref:DUF2971 domain-containing protein n=1 Tax=Nitrosomonas sp. Nm33 TaxID=133724 RepID=UPI00089BE51E|nr:DUF2971 domain-containing protein [Nitrosomonas sp. Nm33]SDY10641.1 Protein of unknown function [Nitrosomonas sp. Nm33]
MGTTSLNHPTYGFRLCKVIYSQKEQKQILNKLLEAVTVSLKRNTEGMNFDSATFLTNAHAQVFEEEVKRYAAFFKHPSFYEEQEWRLVYFPTEKTYSNQIKFRSSSLGIIPFVEIGMRGDKDNDHERILPIISIKIGPTVDSSLARKALEMVVNNRYPNLEISYSTIPLR